jgi:hypothetical protein
MVPRVVHVGVQHYDSMVSSSGGDRLACLLRCSHSDNYARNTEPATFLLYLGRRMPKVSFRLEKTCLDFPLCKNKSNNFVKTVSERGAITAKYAQLPRRVHTQPATTKSLQVVIVNQSVGARTAAARNTWLTLHTLPIVSGRNA